MSCNVLHGGFDLLAVCATLQGAVYRGSRAFASFFVVFGISVCRLLFFLRCSFVLFICQFSLAEQTTDCSQLLQGQFLCPLPDIDLDTQQPRNCDKDSKKAKIQCQAAPGIICE